MLLELDAISKNYSGPDGKVRALSEVSLTLDSGGFVAVQGPSGCGKTTLLLIAGGLLSPDAGRVAVDGHDPYALAPDARAAFRATHVGFVFQQFHLVPYFSVLENILAPALAADHRPPNSQDPVGRARELAEQFGLTSRLNHRPHALSSGERQRTALARSLLNGPKLILADEPTGNLDAENAAVVLACLQSFADSGGGVLLVTHDPAAAAQAQTCLRLVEGRVQRSEATA